MKMNIEIHIVNDNEKCQLTLPELAVAGDSLKELKIPPDTVIITRNGKPIPIDTQLKNKDKLSLIRVLSGG
jgi:sulfur carrier protein ThiS